MTQAILVSGDQEAVMQYTPNADVACGDVIVIGTRPFVAMTDILANAQGSLSGWGGLYKLLKDDTSGPVVTAGEEIAWIDGSDLATDVITGNTHFGYAEAAAGASDGTVLTRHMPHGRTTNTVS